MNGTQFIYNSGEQAAISLTGLLICPVISFVVFYLAVARKNIKETETLTSKAHLFYRMQSGILLGQVINFTFWHVQLVPLFVCVGYYFLEIIEAYTLSIQHKYSNSNATDLNNNMEDVGLNKKTMEKETVFVFNDLTNSDFAEGQIIVAADDFDNKKRQYMLFITLFSFLLICVSNGFHLVSLPSNNKVNTLICYVFNAVSMTIVVCSCMIHAHYHVTEIKRRRMLWWMLITFIWAIIVFSGAIVVLSGIQQATATLIVNNNIFTGIFGVSSGFLLRIQGYFHNIKATGLDKRDVTLGLLVFAVALAQSIAISFYF